MFCIKKVFPAVLLKHSPIADFTPIGVGVISESKIERAARSNRLESCVRYYFKSFHPILQSSNIIK
jgi:hypothetical protein